MRFQENSSDCSGVAAGIVTYNPEIDRLKENIEAISGQVEKVFVYDNASSNIGDIEGILANYNSGVKLYKGEQNKGVAVALNALARAALEEGLGHILLLDQDSIASPSLVAGLLKYSSSNIGIVSPRVVDRNEHILNQSSATEGVCNVPRAITSGSLLNLEVFNAVGGYDEHLFVDWVDFEFCDNLRVHGYGIVRVNDATLLHELGKEEFAGFLPRRSSDGTVRMKAYYRTNHAIWRRRDRARSQAITLYKYRRTAIASEERRIYLKEIIKTIIFEKNRLAILRAIIRGWREGKRVCREEAT